VKRHVIGIWVLVMLWGVLAVRGQEATSEPELPSASVYVTTQDFSSLRAGPGRAFLRLGIVPPTVTLPAYGRTSDTRWIQVEYEGKRGWIAAILLVWTGDVINLPVDGVNPEQFIRRAAALGVTTRETPYYDKQVTPEYLVGYIPEKTELELTGRLGGEGFFRFQVRYQGNLYWVGSWDIRIIDGDYRRLLDLAYLFPYGRLVIDLEDNIAQSLGSYSQILDIWQRLGNGRQVACAPVPPLVQRQITDTDVRREQAFIPAVIALDGAISGINSAISAFEDACSGLSGALTREMIDTQLTILEDAERNLILAGSLIEPLRRRNPVLGSS